MKRQKNYFQLGFRDGFPIGLGYLSVSFAFGIFAKNAGLNVFETLLISMTNLTSAGQLAAVPIITANGKITELVLTQLIINIRYSLMSVSLSQKLGKDVRMIDRFLFSFSNTDEIFAVASSKPYELPRSYLYGIVILPYFCWSLGTLLGALAGNVLPPFICSALGIMIYGMFIAIIVPAMRKSYPTAICVLLSVAISCAFRYIPALSFLSSGFVIIICAVFSGIIMTFLFPIHSDIAEDKQSS